MANLAPLEREALAELEPQLQQVEAVMGFVPHSLLTMARRPDLVQSFLGLARTIQAAPDLEPELVQLVAHVSSTAAGCRYCQAHTAEQAGRRSGTRDRIASVWDFETSQLFTKAEKAALRMARDAALVPNKTTPDHFRALGEHYTGEQIVSLVAVISLFGFLNRWNDTMATELEDEPRSFAEQTLVGIGWQVGKHGAA